MNYRQQQEEAQKIVSHIWERIDVITLLHPYGTLEEALAAIEAGDIISRVSKHPKRDVEEEMNYPWEVVKAVLSVKLTFPTSYGCQNTTEDIWETSKSIFHIRLAQAVEGDLL